MDWGWDLVDWFWNKVLLEHSMFVQFPVFPRNLPFWVFFYLCKKKHTQLWYFILSIPCMKTHVKGVTVTEIRTGLLIIAFKWICLFIGSFLFCLWFAVGSFCYGLPSPDIVEVPVLDFSSLIRALEVFWANKLIVTLQCGRIFLLHFFENVIAPGASCKTSKLLYSLLCFLLHLHIFFPDSTVVLKGN